MRNCFLRETSHLPVKVFRHLESHIKPTAAAKLTSPPKRRAPAKKLADSTSPPLAASLSSDKMDLSPDLYVEAEILEAQREHDPQRESSSAAASRAQSQAQHSSSLGSSSGTRYDSNAAHSPRCTSKVIDSPPTELSETGTVHHDPFVYKSPSTTAVCRLHEFTYSSQYTRPVTELLQEILEVRYPLDDSDDDGVIDEDRPLLAAARRRGIGREETKGWWQKLTGVLGTS